MTPTRIIEVPVTRPCARRARPPHISVPRPTLCLPTKVCYDLPDFANLDANLDALFEWATEMEHLCPPPPSSRPAPEGELKP